MVTRVKTDSGPITIPETIRRRAGISVGDRVEIKAARGVITIVSAPAVEDDEYSPEQRRIIDARLALAEGDVREGRVFGPFDSIAELRKSMRLCGKSPAKRSNRKRS